MSQTEQLFIKWQKWLLRVYDDQLFPLISSKYIFDQLVCCFKDADESKLTEQSNKQLLKSRHL